MKYTQLFIKKLSDIEQLIFLEKELNYQEHLISYLEVLKMVYGDVEALHQKYEFELNVELNKKKKIELKLANLELYPLKPHQKLLHYVEAYQLSSTNISRITSVSPTVIENYLNKGKVDEDTHHFILWGINQFRLPAEDFLLDITSSMKTVHIRRHEMLMS